ncbi:ComF family protein [Pseudoalteromonas sp.]|uniref:ComF family protein n=1 Tax=Pseudoalteromonas sp. TaxID=53249 RepID=UPI0035671FD7
MNFYNKLLNWVLPNLCVSCREQLLAPAKLCRFCLSDIERIAFKDSANLLHHPDIYKLLKSPQFDCLFAVTWYQPPSSFWLKGLKFNKQLIYINALRQLIKQQLKEASNQKNWQHPEVIMPVPLHWFRYFRRGFNQSEEIWRNLNIPIDTQSLIRVKNTKAQSELNKRQRKSNIKGAFSCNLIQPYQHVAIVDDIITTGNTVNELTQLLKKAGVKHVSVWVVAISDPLNKH